jgi:hypothetical protein
MRLCARARARAHTHTHTHTHYDSHPEIPKQIYSEILFCGSVDELFFLTPGQGAVQNYVENQFVSI